MYQLPQTYKINNEDFKIDNLEQIWLEFKNFLSSNQIENMDIVQTVEQSKQFTKSSEDSTLTNDSKFQFLTLLFDLYWKFSGYAQKQQFNDDQMRACMSLFCLYISKMVEQGQEFKHLLKSFSSCVTKFSIDHPPLKVKYFSKEQAKGIMNFWVYQIFWNHQMYNKILATKKVMNLSTFKMFRRKNPMNLPLDSGEEIMTNLLDNPFLRQYLLDEGEFYYTDEEVRHFFEPEKQVERLQKMSQEEKGYVESKYKELARAELIRKVMDAQLVKVKAQVEANIESMMVETDKILNGD